MEEVKAEENFVDTKSFIEEVPDVRKQKRLMPNLSRIPALKPVDHQVKNLPEQNSCQNLVESPVAAPLILPSGQTCGLSLPNNNFLVFQTSANVVPIDQPPAKKIALSDTSEPFSASSLPVFELSDTEEEPETNEIQKFKCKSCEKSFKTQEVADEHWASWHNLPCGLCSERISLEDLPEHYEIVHGGLKEHFPCRLCPG